MNVLENDVEINLRNKGIIDIVDICCTEQVWTSASFKGNCFFKLKYLNFPNTMHGILRKQLCNSDAMKRYLLGLKK